MHKDLQYWPLNEDKKPLYENADGNVAVVTSGLLKPDGEPAHLEYAPEGWNEMLVNFVRNPKALGATRDFSKQLRFVKDGAKIIKDALWRKGIDAIIYLAIWKLNRSAFPDKYEHWYTGELDLSKASQTKTGISAQITEGGLSKLYKANENTTYDISIDTDTEIKNLYFEGLTFTNKIEYDIFEGQEIDGNNYWIGMGIVAQEGQTQGVLIQDEQLAIAGIDYLKNEWFNYSVSKSYTAKLRGTFNLTVNSACTVSVRFKRIRPVTGGIITDDFVIINAAQTTGYKSFPINHDIPMAAGDRLFLQVSGPSPGSSTIWYTTEKGDMSLSYDIKFDSTYVQGLSPKRLCQLLLDKIAPGYSVTSTLLDSLEDSIIITSGASLRKYGAKSYIKTSISEFMKWAQRYGIGWDYSGNELVIEKHEYFFKSNTILNIGIVDEPEIIPAEELIFNTYKFGYQNIDTGKVNGRDEFNVTTSWTSPIKKVIKEMDMVSPYNAGMYPIEAARIDFFGRDTTDGSVDNRTYVLNVEKEYTRSYYTGDMFLPFQDVLQINGTLPALIPGDTITISGAASNNGTFTIDNFLYATGTTDLLFPSNVFTGTPVTINGTITVSSTTHYKLYKPIFTSITGLLHPDEAFNTLITPKDALRNNGGYLRSINDFHDAELIKYTSGERNSELSTTLAGVTTTENADEPIGGLLPQLFKPYYLKCKVKISDEDWLTMNENPFSLINVIIKDKTFSVYKWDGGRNPVTKVSDSFTFLFGPNNDMSKLINV